MVYVNVQKYSLSVVPLNCVCRLFFRYTGVSVCNLTTPVFGSVQPSVVFDPLRPLSKRDSRRPSLHRDVCRTKTGAH